jgi:predicted RNA-binding Zn-ribbon protein involved in translation (DUF1610 family)
MRIITYTCSSCGTVVAANVLEKNRQMKCPRFGCENVIRFDDMPSEAQKYFMKHRDQYRL